MADARKARPVSGEIMTVVAEAAAVGHAGLAGTPDIIDADYEVLSAAARPGPAVQPVPRVVAMPPAGGMDMLRKPEGAHPRSRATRGGPAFWIAGVGVAAAAFWVSGGDSLVRRMPLFATGGQGEVAFTLSGINSRVDVSGAKPLLFVDGEAANDGTGASTLPPLEIRVTGKDGRITRYTLGTAGHALAPGERFAFSSRLEVPKNGVRTVSVAFAE